MIYTEITASSPFIEADLHLSPAQMAMLIKGLKYITPCQSRFSRQSMVDIVTELFSTLSTRVKGCLDDHGWIAYEPKDKQAFPSLEDLLYELQSTRLTRNLAVRARRERAIVQGILHLLRQRPDIIIRRTDKSKVFYVGNARDFACKAVDYMIKTEAYQELISDHCPLADNFNSVKSLVNELLRKKAINQDQLKMMLPKMDTLELAHLHFIPKPHKVILFL